MKVSTLEMIRTALKLDETVSAEERGRFIRVLSGKQESAEPAAPRVVRFKEAARVLGCRPRTVRWYVYEGMLEPVRLRERAIGVTGDSLQRLLESPAKEVNRQPAAQAAGLHGDPSPQLLPAAAGETRGTK